MSVNNVDQRGTDIDQGSNTWSAGLSTWTAQVARGASRGENSGLLVVVMVAVIAIFGFFLRDLGFLSSSNLLSIVRTTTTITVMAVPTVFVICSGEIDLSIASVVSVASLIAASVMQDHGLVLAVLAALGFGAGVGLLNGVVTVGLKTPSFVVTLGTMGILIGLSEQITNSEPVSVSDATFLNLFGGGSVGPIPVLAFWTAGVVILGSIVLGWTTTGRAVLATGANPNAARFSGIRTNRIKLGVLIASGVGGALAGLLYLGQYAAATFTLGSSDLLTVIAAVIIGGTALQGGKGSVLGALIGSLLIGTLNNALIIAGFPGPIVLMVRGAIIVVAVIISAFGVLLQQPGLARWLNIRRRASSERPAEPKETSAADSGTPEPTRGGRTE